MRVAKLKDRGPEYVRLWPVSVAMTVGTSPAAVRRIAAELYGDREIGELGVRQAQRVLTSAWDSRPRHCQFCGLRIPRCSC